MTAIAILMSLNSYSNTKEQSYSAAQAGFLEWVFSLPLTSCPHNAAKRALAGLSDRAVTSDAGLYFYNFLEQAARSDRMPMRRRGGRKARRTTLH